MNKIEKLQKNGSFFQKKRKKSANFCKNAPIFKNLDKFAEKLKNKNVLVYGMGESGRAVVKLLDKASAHAKFYDEDSRFFDHIGYVSEPTKRAFDLVIVSPGVKVRGNDILQHFTQNGTPVISELDFAYLFCQNSGAKIVAVTGTNGKTTVCMLVAKILKEAGYETLLCGNIGLPFSAVCERVKKDTVVVCEVSNFQLETSKFFRADVGCILNVLPDHLDRHGSFEEYVRVKGLLAQNFKKKDLLILNLDDEVAKKMILHKNCMFFSKKTLKKGVFLQNNAIFIEKRKIMPVEKIPLYGEKNLENVLAAVAICSNFAVSAQAFEKAICAFVPAAHRMQVLGTIDGVTFVDDSKATNVASTLACLQAFEREKIWLLLGGQGKEIDYSPIFEAANANLQMVICYGADGENIYSCAKQHQQKAVLFEKFADAVVFAKSNAKSGSFVLLSPACSSFDEFDSYAQRGEHFKNLVLGIEE